MIFRVILQTIALISALKKSSIPLFPGIVKPQIHYFIIKEKLRFCVVLHTFALLSTYIFNFASEIKNLLIHLKTKVNYNNVSVVTSC